MIYLDIRLEKVRKLETTKRVWKSGAITTLTPASTLWRVMDRGNNSDDSLSPMK